MFFPCYNQPMITDEDVKKLKKVFATKDQLQAVNNRLADAIVANQTELREFKEEVRESFVQNTSRIFEAIDSFASEIENHRENEVFHNHKHDRITQRLDQIEKVPVVAYEISKHAD